MSDSESEPRVGILVLNWNSYGDVAQCLDSIRHLSYDNFDIIVVDNGSSDNSGAKLDKDYPNVEVVFSENNLGFSSGNNLGIQHLRDRGADYVWLINNDTEIPDSQTLRKLVAVMESNPGIGIVTPQIYEYPDTDTVWFRRGEINLRFGAYYHSKNKKWFLHGSKKKNLKPQEKSLQEDKSLLRNEYLPFSCALFRETLFSEVGLLPEEYFLYVEDVEYCLRTMNAGYQLATVPDVKVYHEKSSDSSLSPIRSYYGVRNHYLFVRRNSEEIDLRLFYSTYALSIFLLFTQRILAGNFASAEAVIRGVIDAIKMKEGKGPYP